MPRDKHVFILGAGFSVPLGGPLFEELLTHKYNRMLGEVFHPGGQGDTFSTQLILSLPDLVDKLSWRRIKASGNDYRRHFNEFDLDAESLLERLDDIAAGSDQSLMSSMLAGMLIDFEKQNKPPAEFSILSKQAKCTYINRMIRIRLAFETSYFVSSLLSTSARWTPYVNWLKQCYSNDTVITFNYDNAVEMIADRAGKFMNGRKYKPSNPSFYKLHGSADWYVDDDSVTEWLSIKERSLVFCTPPGYQCGFDTSKIPVIGTPGSTKDGGINGLLDGTWRSAMQAIKEANTIAIVGYSMPPTDNIARMNILSAVAEGSKNKDLVMLVSGPAAGTVPARRIKSLIEPLVDCPVVESAYYAQDYLPNFQTYNRCALLQHGNEVGEGQWKRKSY